MSDNQNILTATSTAFSDGNETVTATGNKLSGNVLSNAVNASSPEVESYSINGMKYKSGETAGIFGVGTFKLESNGNYAFSVEGQRVSSAKMPEVSYTVKSGSQTDTSTLNIAIGSKVAAAPYAEADAKASVAATNTINVLNNGSASGNVLAAYEGSSDKPYISGFRIDDAYYASGQTVKVDNLGEITVNRDGSYSVKSSGLAADASLPVIAMTVSNGSQASSVKLTLHMPANANSVLTDESENLAGISGNVLDNARSTLNGTPVGSLGVTSIKADGLSYDPGDTIQFDGGTLQVKANGEYEFIANGAYTVYDVPDVTYTVSNGAKTDTSTLKVSYDWGHLEGDFGMLTNDNGQVISGDNYDGATESKLIGQADNSDLLVGDAYNKTATSDLLIAGARTGASASDVLVGDRLNIDHLSWKSNGSTVQGSSYDNTVTGIRDYLKATTNSSTDEDVIQYVRDNYAKLMDAKAQGGDDTLVGSFKDDILIGGAGNDTLSGAAGKDTFVFKANSNSGHDVITDFTKGYDKIVFTDLVDTSKLNWNADSGILSFTGVQDGHTYQNTITIQNASGDLKLEDLVAITATA
ncbi:MAG: hypothetical protein Q4A84_01480 [Neisseria sp.]|uniref:hypothetical protein n=1 Tax=Neisseria sp. TaxID=192066 RepID=UPI0026DAD7D8|nr:hypothetical protein [Neisseria sp.]MDO4640366.1 hypothetical protein [Neisseria sp.]